MPDLDAASHRTSAATDDRWRQFTASLPMRTALLAVAAVWLLGAVWSFQEQTHFAIAKGFAFPHLLPLVIDGFAIAMAGVAWAASLDARPAVAARLATVVAVAASSASNGAWAYLRTNHDQVAVLLGVAVPVTANLAFEVLLAELRRQVQRGRGLPPPVAIPSPRLVRLVLAPLRTISEWRSLVLGLTAMEYAIGPPRPADTPAVAPTPAAATPAEPSRTPVGERAEPEPVDRVTDAGTDDPDGRQPGRAEARERSDDRRPVPSVPSVPSGATRPRGAGPGSARPPGERANGARTNGTRSDPPARDHETVPARTVDARRPVDPRVELLARHLAGPEEEPDEVTGEMVGTLLDIDVSPRTGRRLLGQARELLRHRAQLAEDDPGLSVLGRR